MNLPTQSQVISVTRHAASFAAGAVAMFGLSSKISPEQITAIINSAGTLVNDGIIFIGLVTPLVTAYFAGHSASPASQKASVAAQPNMVVVETTSPVAAANAIAAIPQVKQVISTQAVADATPSDKVVAKP